jgi:hypothetical protein
MNFVSYLNDDDVKSAVFKVLNTGISKKKSAEKEFYENVIDPFSSVFEVAAFDVDLQTWKNSELIRQCQKTLQNQIGSFHQEILGYVNDWTDMGTGNVVDLKNDKKKIIAEVKNKYNTVSGGDLSSKYETLENLVMPKSSEYKDYTSYFVQIIPKSPGRYNKCFTPSNKEKGTKCPQNELIRIIDGASFYELVTGNRDALYELFQALPKIIEAVFIEKFKRTISIKAKKDFIDYFNKAYISK